MCNTISRLAALLLVLALAGCETVRSTAQFYRPYTTDIFPPKPKDFLVPILGVKPKRQHVVLGRLVFSAGQSHSFMIRSIEYNARRVGADAAILLESKTTSEQYTYLMPGYVSYEPVPVFGPPHPFGGCGRPYCSACYTHVGYKPFYHPGYTGVGTFVRHHIDALLIRFE